MNHEIALVSTNSCDSGVSGLSHTMGTSNTTTNSTVEEVATRNVSVEDTIRNHNDYSDNQNDHGDDASRIDCCDATASSASVSVSSCKSMSDHESTQGVEVHPNNIANDNKNDNDNCNCNSNNIISRIRTKRRSASTPKRRPLFHSSKPKIISTPRHLRLRPNFNRPLEDATRQTTQQTTEDAPSVTDSSASVDSNNNSSPQRLFQDEMDIVAFQEWPPQRRQPRQRHRRSHSYDPISFNTSPSSVCASFSVETIATKLGRSPVVVSFDDVDLVHPPPPLEPISIAGRIPTGRFPRHLNYSFSMDDAEESKPRSGCSDLVADSFFKAIQSTLSHMTCNKRPK